MKFIDPRIDFAFKKIFGSEDTKEILISFLESLLKLTGDKKIRELTILDPYLLPRIRDMKTSILDVRCVDFGGITYIVEMQVRKVRAFLKRIQYNASKTYSNQIAASEDYPRLNQVIAVTITDFVLFDDFGHYVSKHINIETETRNSYLKDMVYYFIELPKFDKKSEELDDVLDKWIFFIKKARELDDIPEKLRESPFSDAFEKARIANMTRQELEDYDRAGMAIADVRGSIELAHEEGHQKGLQEGHQKGLQEGHQKGLFEGRVETARNLLKIGTLTAEQIAQATGLTSEEVKELSV